MFSSCDFFADGDISKNESSLSSITLDKKNITIKVGELSYIAFNTNPNIDVNASWSFNESIIGIEQTPKGCIITGLKEGTSSLTVNAQGKSSTCIVTVSGFSANYNETIEPYIYSNATIMQISPGVTEKVYVSLYGGDASDIYGYNWSIDDNSIASINPTGQYCLVTGKNSGYTRIKVTHSKSAYPYYIGVYVFADATKITYITTGNNILTMNKDDPEQNISVSLVNGNDNSLDSSFTWQIINQDSNNVPVQLQYNGSNAVIRPLESGSCTIRVTHPDATYPLDILCRVITIVKNVYIQPDTTIVYLTGETEQIVTSKLENIDISNYSIDEYEYYLESYNAADIVSFVGNKVVLKGKANGSTKLIISHPKAPYTREVLLIVSGQLTDAVDASNYITTSQNYIRTKVGADPTEISISLKGGEDGDENNFTWTVKSTAADGFSDVIQLETTNGQSVHERAAIQSFAYGKAYITPKAEGTAVITITHPKIVYPTEILVKVLSKDAILEQPLYFAGEGILRILNGESAEYEVQLKGSNKQSSDDQGITWKVDDNRLRVLGSGNVATIYAPSHGTGSTISHITISHKKADVDKGVLVMTADDEETLMSMKALYSDKLYYNFEVGKEISVMCQSVGFEDTLSPEGELIEYDFSRMNWTVNDPSIISITKDSQQPLICNVKGLKAGTTKLIASISDEGKFYTCEFTITVYPIGSVLLEPEVYLTTSQNVVTIGKIGSTANVNISAINLKASEMHNITWESSNPYVATVQSNGEKATFTAVSEGESVISITHPDSQNSLKIYVRVGSEYVLKDVEPVVYIAAQDVMTMLKDDQSQKLQATLVNYAEPNASGFNFSIDNEDVATIYAQSENGIAYIKPIGSGQAEITITHPKTSITKKVLVVVGNSAEELAGYTYLTTQNNVVAIGEGNTKSVSVTVKNSPTIIVDGYNWTSNNPSVVDITPSGATAVLKGNQIGTALITVTNKACKYSLQIIAQVVDPVAAAANPYIQLTSSVLTLTTGNTYTTVSAELVGGKPSDNSDFIWISNDSKIATVFGQNEVGKIKALTAGTTYITVSHPKAMYSAQILVVCDEATQSDCYISVPNSIITMKPTDATQTISATLVNGTTTDKYSFSWSVDVYDVIDIQNSANICTITPKQTGTATITIRHPKAAYDQQIIVNVQQYTTFAFPYDNLTITQGDVKFIGMQVPGTNVTTHIEYSVENANICTIRGTKATSQITAVGSGTTIVTARLIASSSGMEQARAEMMIYVEPRETDAIYITSTQTINTVQKGKSQTLTASLTGVGVVASDQYNLQWTTSDSDIVQVVGIGSDGYVRGQSIYITALKSGEAIITCSHPKAASTLQFYVVVPGNGEKTITFDKSYMTLVAGNSGTATTLKATIENAEGNSDYQNLIWTCVCSSDVEVCRLMGDGKTVSIYPIKPGQATVMAQLPDSSSVAKCTVVVEAGKSFTFETNTRRIEPMHSKIVKYKVSPPNAILTWVVAQEDDYFTYIDNGVDEEGNGSVEIIGNSKNKSGNGTLACVTDGGAKGQLTVRVSWDYDFRINGKTDFTITPDETATIEYSVSPIDSKIEVSSTDTDITFTYELTDNGDGTGKVAIRPLAETNNAVQIYLIATNPNNNDEEVGRKLITGKFLYRNVTPKISLISSDGKYSYYNQDANALVIGDGEAATMNFAIEETGSNAYVSKVEFTPKVTEHDVIITAAGGTDKNAIYTVNHGTDIIKYDYVVDKLLIPYYGGTEINWMTQFSWGCYYHNPSNWGNTKYEDYCGLGVKSRGLCNPQTQAANLGGTTWYMYHDDDWSKNRLEPLPNWTLKEDLTWRGKIISEEELKHYAWLYCPGTPQSGQRDFWYSYEDFENGTLVNGTFGRNAGCDLDPRIMTEHISYHEIPVTDTTKKDIKNIGVLTIYVIHNGKTTTYKTDVLIEVRYCEKTYE